MDFVDTLAYKHSKETTNMLVYHIIQTPSSFDHLFSIFVDHDDKIIRQRAAWVIGDIGVDHPKLLIPYLEPLIHNLQDLNHHNAIYRNSLRALQFLSIPKHLQGSLVDSCMNFVTKKSTSIAVRAFSMSILYNISEEEKDLKNELKIVLEDLLPYASKGEKNRASKILHCLTKELAE